MEDQGTQMQLVHDLIVNHGITQVILPHVLCLIPLFYIA